MKDKIDIYNKKIINRNSQYIKKIKYSIQFLLGILFEEEIENGNKKICYNSNYCEYEENIIMKIKNQISNHF